MPLLEFKHSSDQNAILSAHRPKYFYVNIKYYLSVGSYSATNFMHPYKERHISNRSFMATNITMWNILNYNNELLNTIAPDILIMLPVIDCLGISNSTLMGMDGKLPMYLLVSVL